MPYQDFFRLLVKIGLIDVILPFLLIFIITFGIFEKTKVFGTKKANAILAMVLAFFTILSANLLNVVNIMMFYFVILLVIGLMIALVLGMSGAQVKNKNKLLGAIVLGFAVLFVFLGLVRLEVIETNKFWAFVIIVTILGIIIYAFSKFYKEKKIEKTKAKSRTTSAEGEQEF